MDGVFWEIMTQVVHNSHPSQKNELFKPSKTKILYFLVILTKL